MYKKFLGYLPFVIILSCAFLNSCSEDTPDPTVVIIRDTVTKLDTTYLKDTLIIGDTIFQGDTLRLIDTLILIDTLMLRDTLFFRDTTLINRKFVNHSGLIRNNETWSSEKIHRLVGFVTVINGATLTIEAGTRIEAMPGITSSASALMISKDAKIDAQGTAEAPIIMTSVSDNGNLSDNASALWGGLIVLGDDYISADAQSEYIEGLSSSPYGIYGGTNSAHNAGKIRYVSVRHAGVNIGEGNEINAFTFAGVGSLTVVENIEVVGTQDDGIELFGGSVNVTNAIIYYNGDDAIDTDQAWTGTLDNVISIFPGDTPLELDGPEGSLQRGDNKIRNFTSYGAGDNELIDFDDNTNSSLDRLFFMNYSSGARIGGYDGFSSNGGGNKVSNVEYMGQDVFGSMPAKSVSSPAVGADKTKFNWTYTSTTSIWDKLK